MASVHEYEKSLGGYLYAKLAEIPGLTLYGPSPSTCPDRAALVAFNHESVHPSDLATFLDQARDRAEIAPRYTRDTPPVKYRRDGDLPSRSLSAINLGCISAQEGVAVRSGHHCTQPLHDALGVSSSARASLYIYNTEAEVSPPP